MLAVETGEAMQESGLKACSNAGQQAMNQA
ncbi:hypothetical protein R69919_03834 [Paraburkholderia gardini]|uniref:Uncharacterized protein n=1 Tax=Paraburkholderia gardini TaxID=2823469 RepID=A0ABN7QM20_9BURK|nr:hypothetical protein R54767_03333 [Paraburkholderia gardini]CAG4910848.1 hypothetical protein R69919_03834 [Paraburkholderia gardini]